MKVAASLFGRHVAGSAENGAVGGVDGGVGGVRRWSGDRVICCLCWRFVEQSGGIFGLTVEKFGEAPVHDENFAEGADHDVFRLEVAVEDAAGVGKGDGF